LSESFKAIALLFLELLKKHLEGGNLLKFMRFGCFWKILCSCENNENPSW